MINKAKLSTEIEKITHRYLESVKEMAVDSTILFMQRNNIPVDRDSMMKTIEVFKESLDSQQMQQFDKFVLEVDKVLSKALKDD